MFLPSPFVFVSEIQELCVDQRITNLIATNSENGKEYYIRRIHFSYFSEDYKCDDYISYQNNLKALNSPFIVTYDFIDRVDQFIYLARKVVPGISLNSANKETFLHIGKTKLFVLWKIIVRSFVHLHINNIFPTFLKLSSIIFTDNGAVALVDLEPPRPKFNLQLTQYDPSSFGLASPEIMTNTVKPSKESDVWSLGVLLFYMMKNEFPWCTSNKYQMVQEITKGTFNPNKVVPSEIKAIIRKTVNVDPSKRIASEALLKVPPGKESKQTPNIGSAKNRLILRAVNTKDLIMLSNKKNLAGNKLSASGQEQLALRKSFPAASLETFKKPI